MTKEHYFPKWLIEFAGVHHEGITWLDGQNIDPDKATIPLCQECNEKFGTHLEGPIAEIFRELERGNSISEHQAELLVRWLWKFEGLQWAVMSTHRPEGVYTRRYTLRDRVITSQAFDEVRNDMMLAVALINSNDPGFKDWPLGLDTPPSENAITMSGVFGRIALICSFSRFSDAIPDVYGKFQFGCPPEGRDAKAFLAPVSFIYAGGAIETTTKAGHLLAQLHDEWGRDENRLRTGSIIIPDRRRVELPSLGRLRAQVPQDPTARG